MTDDEYDIFSTNVSGAVYETAVSIFEACGFPEEFCVQAVNYANVVFGKTNRIVWKARSGWRADRGYCTTEFLDSWDRIRENYNGT